MTLSIEEFESILDVYPIEEILEMNNLTVADALEFLVHQEFVILPDPQPVTVEHQWEDIQNHEQND